MAIRFLADIIENWEKRLSGVLYRRLSIADARTPRAFRSPNFRDFIFPEKSVHPSTIVYMCSIVTALASMA